MKQRPKPAFSSAVLNVDADREIARIVSTIRRQLSQVLKRRGAVLGLSGGIDSSVAATLCVRALGPDRVLGLLLPERESAGAAESLAMGKMMVDHLGIRSITEDITDILTAAACYERRDEAIRAVIPDYRHDWKCKIVLPSFLESRQYRVFSVVVEAPDGSRQAARLPLRAYLNVVAATSFKQRTRKMMEYIHADRSNYAVVGTPNLLEFELGFFVKQGDSMGDIMPIAHLYKTQVYALAEALGLPEVIRRRLPTTDTYSLEQGQEEFFFSLPYQQMDLCLYAHDQGIPAADVAAALGSSEETVARVFDDIESKRQASIYGHLPPLLVEDIEPIEELVAAARRGGREVEERPHGSELSTHSRR